MNDDYVGSRFSRALEEIYGDKNNKIIADKYGYTQQAIGKLKTKKAINETICLISENENIDLNWLQTGKGEMLLKKDENTTCTGTANNHSYEFDMLNIKAGAGEGIYNYEVEVVDRVVLDKAFFKMEPDTNKIKIIEVCGDSMEPTLIDGDHILIDESKTNKIDGIYAVQWDGQILVKRLEFNLDDTINIISDNKRYTSKTYDPKDTQIPFRIIGMKVLSIQR